ncbi:NAD(P)/FAD-dependent oxidoreductase [Paraburkholderia kirstenboschensis]|uniref:NAD(P)/FAD-dependent oxidoreductase n=1 Tax=Paraburkholderia kirstenboschensis TaxID=1245436 RepID=A0ABZ0EAV3_9BURK|nr:NAD(P)/FAD-dependent oxidoreductase [Paraburkholderia kirstenboschensis]WOD14365.1 NAD(P)/FAD-dependent oxidoreductase [Paraburkholderia kirstenboschensis]
MELRLRMTSSIDCVIVGAGPAGLTAALYLARYRRSVKVFDSGESRARLIPLARNVPGFPSGISGEAWLASLREQLEPYLLTPQPARVETIEAADNGFRIDYRPLPGIDEGAVRSVHASRVLLAAGIRDGLPSIPNAAELTRRGLFRLCPICDGYETDGQRIAMLGPAKCALSHAVFMRTFSRDVSVVASDLDALSGAEVDSAVASGIGLIELSRLDEPEGAHRGVQIISLDGAVHRFDSVYPVMGCNARTDVLGLKVERDDDGMVRTDKHQRTSIRHLYAAGDIVNTLNQISVASGEAAIAATEIHRSLPQNPR